MTAVTKLNTFILPNATRRVYDAANFVNVATFANTKEGAVAYATYVAGLAALKGYELFDDDKGLYIVGALGKLDAPAQSGPRYSYEPGEIGNDLRVIRDGKQIGRIVNANRFYYQPEGESEPRYDAIRLENLKTAIETEL